jgi:hypothetical protein
MKTLIVVAVVVLALCGVVAGTAQADVAVCPGTAACKEPRGLAVDFETGNLYVADSGNDRVDIFKNGGTEVGTPASFPVADPQWIAVDNVASSASHHDVYLSTGFTVKKFEPDGTLVDEFGEQGDGTPEPCQLERADDPIAAGPDGDVYLADSYKSGAVTLNRIVKFDDTGACVGEVPLFEGENKSIRDLAVDSAGNIYVTVAGGGGVIRKYDPAGSLVKEFEVLETKGLAVDDADNPFAEQRGRRVIGGLIHFFTEYSPSGTILRRFGYAPRELPGFVGLAAHHSADGDLYTGDGSAVTYRSLPEAGPVFYPEACRVKGAKPGSVRATLQAEVNPEGKATEFRFEYLTQEQYEEEGDEFENAHISPPQPLEAEGAVAEDFELHEAATTIEPLEPETEYRCRIVATNADSGPGGTVGEEGTFKTTEPFVFGPAWSSQVGGATATIFAEGNPNGAPSTAEIEYVADASYRISGFAGSAAAPDPRLDYGAGEGGMVLRAITLTGLEPGTLYHYRLRAFQPLYPDGLVCPEGRTSCPQFEHTFRTYPATVETPDGRGYELVSPGQKNSAEAGGPPTGRGFAEQRAIFPFAAAPSGESITYTSWTSFGQAQGAPATSQYLATRNSETGWGTDNISPFGFQGNLFVPPYLGFTDDLAFGAVKAGGPGDAALAPGCPAGFENFYLREDAGGTLRCLTPEAPAETDHKFAFFFTFGGASEDGGRIFFRSEAGYAGVESGISLNRYNLYEWHEGRLRPVGVLPGESEPIQPTRSSAFGAESFEPTQTGQTFLAHAISADGSRAIWTYVPEAVAKPTPVGPGVWTLGIENAAAGTFTLSFESQSTAQIAFDANAATIRSALEVLSTVGAGNVEVSGAGPFTVTFKGALAGTTEPLGAGNSGLVAVPTRLLDRIDGTTTIQLDEKRTAGGTSGNGLFWAASTDGSVVYFTSPNRLTAGARAEVGAVDLYRAVLGADPTAQPTLTDLTSGSGRGTVPGDVQGVLGASDDGARIYFVARAALTPEAEENQAGEHAEEGQDNLYLYDATEDRTRFIATLSGEDNLDWESQPRNHTSRVSPDGLHLAFLSTEAGKLAGYDNELVTSGGRFGAGEHCQLEVESVEGSIPSRGSTACPQAFLYDAEANALHCASCNPAGSRPLGPALLPGWTNMAEGPRYLSDDGSRLFFESFDRLLPADESLRRDVYEFELPGAGSCTTASSAYVPSSGGCLFLISGGRGDDENHLIDASADGRDVFFSTRERLLPGRDPNGNYDIYDYRVGGGFAEPVEATPCASPDACKPPASSTSPTPTPGTPTFNGPGNLKPTRHRCPKGKVPRRVEGRKGKARMRCVKRHARHSRHHARHHRKERRHDRRHR